MDVSVSPVTGRQYDIPAKVDDHVAIDAFCGANAGKPVVAVQGLGFVGAVMALVCANALGRDYAVLGVDLPTPEAYWRIASINEGVFPLTAEDPTIPEFFAWPREQGNFLATHDPSSAASPGSNMVWNERLRHDEGVAPVVGGNAALHRPARFGLSRQNSGIALKK